MNNPTEQSQQPEQSSRQHHLLAEQMNELQEYAASVRQEWKQNHSSQEVVTSQLRSLQDEINHQANELQCQRTELVRQEARLQQWEKSLQEEKSAWAATQKYAGATSASSVTTSKVVSEQDQSTSHDFLQHRKQRLQKFKQQLSELHRETQQQIEDWKQQIEHRDDVHFSRKVAFEKQLTALAVWEQTIAEREQRADVQQEDLSQYETKLALQEHEMTSPGEENNTEETKSSTTMNADINLNIDLDALFDDDVEQDDESNQKEGEDHSVRSALADMFDLPDEKQSSANQQPEEKQEAKPEPQEIKQVEVELASARFMNRNTEALPETPTSHAVSEPEETEEVEEAESVTAYMERLLGRTHSKETAVETTVNSQQDPMPNNSEEASQQTTVVEEVKPVVVSSEPKHKLDKVAVQAQRDSLRELANLSARTAVAKYTTAQMQTQVMFKYLLTGLTFVVAIALLICDYLGSVSFFSAGMIASVVFCAMGIELIRTLRFMRHVNSVDGQSLSADGFEGSAEQEVLQATVTTYESVDTETTYSGDEAG